MSNVGNATLIITPKFDGLSASVNQALAGVDATAGGRAVGDSVAGGMASRQGAIIGAFSELASRAMNAVTSSLGSAVSRVDTLKNYPMVMQSLGVGADEATASIQTMSDRLQGLPTRLDDMASTVQGLYAATSQYGVSLSDATEAGLALNDLLLAGGGSTQVVNSAMEQFRQMLSKGKPDMQDWRALLSAAPGQMNQLAEAMLGAGASANDLYYALGGGKDSDEHTAGIEFASLSMEDLLQALIALDSQGGDALASFADQASEAQGGIGTAFANMQNAVTRGLADVMDSIGRENIVGVIDDVKGAIRDAFDFVSGTVVPGLQGVFDAFGGGAGAIVASVGALGTLAGVLAGLGPASSGLAAAADFVFKLAEARNSEGLLNIAASLSGLSASIGPFVAAAGIATLVIGALAGAAIQAKEHQDNLAGAVDGMSGAVSRLTSLDMYTGTIEDLGLAAGVSALSVDDLARSVSGHADVIRSNVEQAETQIGTLNTAQQIIEECAGQTDLSAEAQGRLQWAIGQVNEQLGTNITLEDAMAGKYTDQNGEVHDLCDALDDLVEKRKQEIRVSALTDSLTEAYEAQSEAASTLAHEQAELAQAEANLESARERGVDSFELGFYTAQVDEHRESVEEAQAVYDSTTDAVAGLESELGMATRAAEGMANEYERWASGTSQLFQAQLAENGTNAAMLAEDLASLGISVSDLSELSEDELSRLAFSYDGTAESIVSDLEEMGVAVGLYNGEELLDKDGNITVDQFELKDAQGNVYSWNGTTLVDKKTGVEVNDVQLQDALGRRYTWNNGRLETMTGLVQMNTTQLSNALDLVLRWNQTSLNSKSATASAYAAKYSGNAAGGVRLHASGAIATSAVPLDIVGEDGAEAIVPLTNRRYSQPFVNLIADGVSKQLSGGTTVNVNLSYEAGEDANRMARDIARSLELVAISRGW